MTNFYFCVYNSSMVDTNFELSCKDCGSLLFKSDIEYSYDDFGKFYYVKIYCLTCGKIREDKKMISETMARMSKSRIREA
jgi:RNase P subunit RPR2